MIAISQNTRHCERSEALQGDRSAALDCIVASLLAMTIQSRAIML
jgi:hypothetical protein